jgi:hypothetical protein
MYYFLLDLIIFGEIKILKDVNLIGFLLIIV